MNRSGNPRCFRLSRLSPADLQSLESGGRMERHVLCFKRSHTVSLLSEDAAEGRRQERLAYVRGSS